MSMYTASRQVLPPAMRKGLGRVNSSSRHTSQQEIINIVDSGNPKTPLPPPLSTLALGTLDYTIKEDQMYHTERNKRHNIDEYFEFSIDTAEHISEQLCKTAVLIRKKKIIE